MSESVERAPTVVELLTEQFYQWELRGRGWVSWDRPVELEPPFRPFEGHFLPPSYHQDDGVEETPLSRFADKFLGFFGAKTEKPAAREPDDEVEEPPPGYLEEPGHLVELQVALPPDENVTREVFEQCLFSLGSCHGALAFEVVGSKEGLVTQLAAGAGDAPQVLAQLRAHFPDAVINQTEGGLQERWGDGAGRPSEVREFGLDREFMLPLNPARELATDPLVGICAALEHVGEGEAGVFQVLFQPARHRWAESIGRAVKTSDGEPFFSNAPEIVLQANRKLARPLFAVVVRVAATSQTPRRVWEITEGLGGALNLFANPAGNELIPLENKDYPDDAHESDLLHRRSRRCGMLLNSEELASLAHLPAAAVRSRKLLRVATRTKEPPTAATGDGVLLGENVHEGRVTLITLKPDQRVRHVHVIGASGTGKSTLLLNLIRQDVESGQGIAVLDPHGDLIDDVLARVPGERERDVILFDAADDEFPVGFNVLSAHSNLEKNLLASDLVAVFRRLSTSWGDQMNSVLGNAILAFLESSNGGTLADVRRFLLEPAFRKEFLGTVQDPDVVYYWEHAFPVLKSGSVGPLLTRLDTFLRPKAIRYMVGQRENKLDFGAIMNEGKVFLAKLPQGIIGEENAFLLGALLVAKFHQLAISRQQMEARERRPFYLYLDEFHNFATPSMATILSGVRKYQLGLVLAHHELRQLQRSDELASAVLSHPYTRVCFRLGDEDARRLADGFSFFETSDLQNLGTGEAVCRMERADFDFNLRTVLPPKVEDGAARERRAHLQRLSRERYGTPRAEVEKELVRSRAEAPRERVDPFATRTVRPTQPLEEGKAEAKRVEEPVSAVPPAAEELPKSTSPPPRSKVTPGVPRPPGEPPPQGKGGREHLYLQQMVKQLGEQRGWRALIEEGNADVALLKEHTSVACEILVTTPVAHDVEVLRKRLAAGFTWVVMLSADPKHLGRVEEEANKRLSEEDLQRVHCLKVEELPELLERLDAAQASDESTVKGYRVKTSYKALGEAEKQSRKDSIAQAIARGLKRIKDGGK